jgi:DNA mismatch repair protein MutL
LKKDYTEAGYIEDVITRLALVHPEIAFKLTNAGKTIIRNISEMEISEMLYTAYMAKW